MENQTQEQLQEQIDELEPKVAAEEEKATNLERALEVINNSISVLQREQQKMYEEQQKMYDGLRKIYPYLKNEDSEDLFWEMMLHQSPPKWVRENMQSDGIDLFEKEPSLEDLSAIATRHIPDIIEDTRNSGYYGSTPSNREKLQDLRQQLENMKNDTGDIE